jgi:hypothetical protein
MSTDDRYDKTYTYGDVEFYLSDFMPIEEQCRFLILKILEQAVRDYTSLYDSDTTSEQLAWESAEGFLFDDEYYLMWGDLELSTEEFLELVDLDIRWVREQTRKQFERKRKECPARRKQKKKSR